jgi:hypothetical protein
VTKQLVETGIFDFDNHYYESHDAFTRHADRGLRYRGVRWADVDGKRRLLVGGNINSYVANPTFDPVAKPGALYDWYRGNPRRQQIRDAFGELEPVRSEYRDREVRLKVMEQQGLAGTLLFPTLGVGVEDALRRLAACGGHPPAPRLRHGVARRPARRRRAPDRPRQRPRGPRDLPRVSR